MTDSYVIELIESASCLCEKLKLVHNDPKYLAVWHLWFSHFGDYDGPQYGEELEKLQTVLNRKSYIGEKSNETLS